MNLSLALSNRCPICQAQRVSATPDSAGRIWFTCASAYRDGVQIAKGDECRVGRVVQRVRP